MRIGALLIGFIIFGKVVLHASEPLKVYSLAECVDIAIKNNVTLKQSKLNLQSQQNTYQFSKEALLPTVNGNAVQGFNFGRTINPVSNQFVESNYSSNQFSINAQVTVFNGFRLVNTVKQQSFGVKSQEWEYKNITNTISLNVLNSYLQILFNKQAVKNAEYQLQTTKIQLERTERLVKAGILPENNLYSIAARVASDESALINAENQLMLAKINLLQTMNIATDATIIAETDIEEVTYKIDSLAPNFDTEWIFKTALNQQPSVKRSEYLLKSRQYAYQAAYGNMFPRITLSAQAFTFYSSISRRFSGIDPQRPQTIGFLVNNPAELVAQPGVVFNDYPFYNQITDNFAQAVSINLIVPIYNNRQLRGAVQTAEIQQASARLDIENTHIELRRNIEQAAAEASAAHKQYEAARKQKNAAEENFKAIQKAYNAGTVNFLDFNTALNQLYTSENELSRAKYDWLLKTKIVEFYTQGSLDLSVGE